MENQQLVRDQYGADSLQERVANALARAGLGTGVLNWRDLVPLDQFHVRGLAATKDLAESLNIQAESKILDIGCGLGVPARFLAATYACHVTGIDLSQPFVERSPESPFAQRKCVLPSFPRSAWERLLCRSAAHWRSILDAPTRTRLHRSTLLLAFSTVCSALRFRSSFPSFPSVQSWFRTIAFKFTPVSSRKRRTTSIGGGSGQIRESTGTQAKTGRAFARQYRSVRVRRLIPRLTVSSRNLKVPARMPRHGWVYGLLPKEWGDAT
jgi:hypothetical protein